MMEESKDQQNMPAVLHASVMQIYTSLHLQEVWLSGTQTNKCMYITRDIAQKKKNICSPKAEKIVFLLHVQKRGEGAVFLF